MVSVFMMTISWADAPTRSHDFLAQSSAKSCHWVSGEFSRLAKWPLTPMDAQVSSCAEMYSRDALGWAPSELPTK